MAKKYPITQVDARAMPGVTNSNINIRANADAFGGAKARDAARFGAALQSTGEYMQSEVNKAEVRDQLNGAREKSRQFMSDLQKRKGADALTSHADTKKAMADFRKGAHKGLTNGRQQKMFDSVFDSMANSDMDRAMAHQGRESFNYTLQTLDAENANEIQDALRDPFGSQAHLKAVDANTAKKMEMLGVHDPEQREKHMRDARTNFHSQMAKSIGNSSAKLANEYLDKYGKTMNKEVVDGLKAKYKTQGVREEALAEAREMYFGKVHEDGWKDAPTKTPEESLKWIAENVDDPDKARAMRTHIKTWEADKAQAAGEAQQKALSDALGAVMKNPQLSSIPEDLPPADRLYLETHINRVNAAKMRAGGNGKVQTNWGEYTRLRYIKDEDLAGENDAQWRSVLSDKHYEEYLDRKGSDNQAIKDLDKAAVTASRDYNKHITAEFRESSTDKEIGEKRSERVMFEDFFKSQLKEKFPRDKWSDPKAQQEILDFITQPVNVGPLSGDVPLWKIHAKSDDAIEFDSPEAALPDALKGLGNVRLLPTVTLKGGQKVKDVFIATDASGTRKYWKNGVWFEAFDNQSHLRRSSASRANIYADRQSEAFSRGRDYIMYGTAKQTRK